MPEELKPTLSRQMEIYAAFLEHTDDHVGRLADALKDIEVLDDTLVIYIIGDNGASAEETMTGSFNELCMLNGMAAIETIALLKSKIDDFGGRTPTTTTGSVGRMRWTPPTNNEPSRLLRIGAARAMERSCTGRKGSKPREKSVRSSVMSSTSRPPRCQ
jgi:arylsulfatase A-like enzyme